MFHDAERSKIRECPRAIRDLDPNHRTHDELEDSCRPRRSRHAASGPLASDLVVSTSSCLGIGVSRKLAVSDGSAVSTRRCTLTVLSLLASACLLGGCGAVATGGGHNKAGAAVDSPQVMRLEDPDPSDPEMVYLAQQIQRRSHGSLRVQVADDYPSALPSNEARLARAVRAGRVGFAFLAARAWPAAAVPAFAALQAPFVIDTYPAARAAAAGPAGRLLLGQLAGAGLGGSGARSDGTAPTDVRLAAEQPG